MVQKTLIKTSILVLFCFFLLASSAGYVMRTQSQTVCLGVSLFIVIAIALKKMKIHTDRVCILAVLLLCILGALSSIIASDPFDYMLCPIIAWIIAMMFVLSVTKIEFEKMYVYTIAIICVVSIVAYILFFFFPRIITSFPVVINSAGGGAYNLFITTVPFSYGHIARMQGIFWEPGAFQIFVLWALLILRVSDSIYKKDILSIIFIVSMILSFSTTAYIELIMVLLIILKNGSRRKKCKNAIKIVLALVVVSGIVEIAFGIENVWRSVFADKFSSITIGNAMVGTAKNESTQVRLDSIFYPIQVFLHNPILGGGSNGLLNLRMVMGHGMTTCTPINFFATNGIVYGSIAIYMCYCLSSVLSKSANEKILRFLLILFSISTEDMNGMVFFDIILLYGFLYGRKRSKVVSMEEVR